MNEFNYSYVWENTTGNLLSRTDHIHGLTESFDYDNLERLEEITEGTNIYTNDYDLVGNFEEKHDVGAHNVPSGQYQAGSIENDEELISFHDQNVSFTTYNEPKVISENNVNLQFEYRHHGHRTSSRLSHVSGPSATAIETKKYYPEMGYEEFTDEVNDMRYHIFHESVNGKIISMIVKEEDLAITGGDGTFTTPTGEGYNSVYTDHLGSILKITDENGGNLAKQSFDAHGRKRNPFNWQYSTSPVNNPDWLYRGYTGHEHLDEFALVHMNGRLYAPLTGRMLSPDNYVQAPLTTQGYNRYAYAFNNPLKYTDPSGEFFVADSWAVGFVDGFFSTSSDRWNAGLNEANHRASMDARIWGGLFASDPNKSFGGRVWEVTSRLTWQLPQTTLGFLWNQGNNTVGRVEDVEYFHGATFVVGAARGGNAVSLGSYISISPVSEDDQANIRIGQDGYTTMHEYGHYLQSQKSGPLYLLKYGIPSALGDADWTEHDANTRAANYFQKIDPSFNWVQTPSRYRTLADKVHNPRWFEYPLFFLGGGIGTSLIIGKNWSEPW